MVDPSLEGFKILFLNTTVLLLSTRYFVQFNSDLPLKTLRTTDYIKPISYDIHLAQGYNNMFFDGRCHITIKINRPTDFISFHVQITQVNLKYVQLQMNSSSLYVAPWKFVYCIESQILVAYFSQTLNPGYYILHTEYELDPNNYGEGFFKTSYINEKGETMSLFATQFHAIGARQMFPCWDEPAFKAIFKITIKHYKEYTALSNMPIRDTKIEKDTIYTPFYEIGREIMLTYFKETPITPTYFVAIMVSDFPNILINGMNIRCHTQQLTPYLRFAATIAANITKTFESKNKISTLFLKVNHIVIPGFPHESTENLGLIFYRDSIITYNETSDPIAHKLNVVYVVGRALVQQIFNPFWWSYAWIHKGFSILTALDQINQIYPDFRMLDLFVVQVQQESLRLDIDSIMKPLTSEANSASEINSHFSFAYYMKAPAVLRMLQHVLTDKVFWNVTTKFLRSKSSLTAKPDNVWTAMQDALNETLNKSKFRENLNIKEIMNPWTQLTHYPVLEVIQLRPSYVIISLENYDSLNQEMIWIPVTFIILDNIYDVNITISLFATWLPKLSKLPPSIRDRQRLYPIHYNSSKLIIVNFQQVGYYRVKYFVENWRKIAKYLNTTQYTKINVLNRAQIIDDAFYFLMKDQLDLSIFLELTEYLKQETDYVAWYPMIKALEYMSCFFSFDESAHIKAHMRDILSELLSKIRYAPWSSNNDIMKCLRQEAVRWACILGSDICKKSAVNISVWHATNPVKNKIPPSWKEWTYYNSLTAPNRTVDDNWWEEIIIKEIICDNKLLEFLSCSASSFNVLLIHNYLDRITNISQYLSECNFRGLGKDVNMLIKIARVNSFLLTVAKHANNKTVHKYLVDHFEKVRPREVSICAMLITIVNHVYSEEQIDQVTKFVENYYKKKEIFYISKVKEIGEIFRSQNDHREIMKCIKNYIGRVISIIRDRMKIRAIEIAKQRSIFKILDFE